MYVFVQNIKLGIINIYAFLQIIQMSIYKSQVNFHKLIPISIHHYETNLHILGVNKSCKVKMGAKAVAVCRVHDCCILGECIP